MFSDNLNLRIKQRMRAILMPELHSSIQRLKNYTRNNKIKLIRLPLGLRRSNNYSRPQFIKDRKAIITKVI